MFIFNLKKTTKRILIVFSSIFISLVISEMVLRLVNYEMKELPWINGGMNFFNIHPSRIYFLNANANFYLNEVGLDYYRTDSLGFRYNPHHNTSDESDLTIIMVGDSFTYGVGNGFGVKHEEAYPAVVEKLLRENGIRAVVHNAGVPGYGPDQEFIYMRDELIPKYKPDLIVWNLSTNDVNDANFACLFSEKNGKFQQISGRQNIQFIQGLLIKHSYRFFKNSYLYNLLLYSPIAFTKSDRFTFGCSFTPNTAKEYLSDIFSRKMRFFFERDP